jgi:DNA-binding NarL/FixJ family response regulator
VVLDGHARLGKEPSGIKGINPKIKVLLSSGYSTDGEVGEILKEGVEGMVQKPYKDEELIEKVREILDL